MILKKLSPAVIFILMFNASAVSQGIDEILENHFRIVGQEKLLSVQSIKTQGVLRQGGFEIPFTTYAIRPNKYRIEGRYEGFLFVEVFNGENGWTFNQLAGDEAPKLISGPDLETLKDQADIDGLLYNYREKGYTIELLDPVKLGNILTDVIVLTKPNDTKITYFFDSETSVIVQTLTRTRIVDRPRDLETRYFNYSYVDEILFPLSVDIRSNGQTVLEFDYETIEFDIEINELLFEIPKSLTSEEAEEEF